MSYLRLHAGAAPPPPDAGVVFLFVDEEDGHLKQIDSFGTVLDLVLPPRIEFARELGFLNTAAGSGTTQDIAVTVDAARGLVVLCFAAYCDPDATITITDTPGNTWVVDAHRNDTNNLVFIASTGQDIARLVTGDIVTIDFVQTPDGHRVAWLELFDGVDTGFSRVNQASDETWLSSPTYDSGTTAPTTVSRGLAVTAFVSTAQGWGMTHNEPGTVGTYLRFPAGFVLDAGGSDIGSAAYQVLTEVGEQREVVTSALATGDGNGLIVVYAAEIV